MKKNIFKIILVAAIAMACDISFLNSQKSEALSDITLANVEALAHEEWYNGNCYWVSAAYLLCEPDGNFDPCPCGSYGIN